MKRNIRIGIGIVVVVALAIVLIVTQTKKELGEIKIGAILPLTGDAASWGAMGKEGIDLAIDDINHKGGIKSKKLRVIYEDTRAKPSQGVNAVQKLITVDKVTVIIGDIVSATTLAIAPVAEKNKVVILSPTASAPKISEAGDFIFRIWPSDIVEGTVIANFAYKDMNFRNIAILYINNDYGIALKDVFRKVFTTLGGQIATSIGYNPDEIDFRSHLSKINKTDPDAIYLVSYYKDAALVFNQAKEMGIKKQFLGSTALEEPKLLEICGNAADGVIYPMSTGYNADSPEIVVQQFKKKFRAKYSKDPGFVAAQCYDAVKIIAWAIEKAGNKGYKIQKVLSTLEGYKGITGETSFDEKGDVIKPTIIKYIKDGKFLPYIKSIER